MLSKTTRFEILLDAGPDPVEGMSQRVWRILAGHEVDCLPDRSPGSIGFDRELSGRRRDGSELPVSINLSRDTRGVLLDHGGG